MMVVTLGLFFAFIVTYEERNAVYHYDVKKDYIYDFNHTHLVKVHYQLHNGKIATRGKAVHQDAVFLKISLKTTLAGHFFDPKIFISAGNNKVVQTIERGGEGARYLNLSGLNLHEGATITVTGRFVHIRDQQITLIYLKHGITINNARILVISPHPDDAEIAAFGLYSGHDAYVVTIAAGDAGSNKYDEIFANRRQQYLAKARMRVWNSLTVPLLGNVNKGRAVNLGYFDGTLEKMHASVEMPVHSLYTGVSSINFFRGPKKSALLLPHPDDHASWITLVQDLRHIIQVIRPDIIVAPYPRIDRHPDHKMSTVAVIEAIRKLNMQNGYLFLYTNHYPLSDYYPYGNAGEPVTLPPAFGSVYFDDIYSYELAPEAQKMKLLALEAMNDMRLDTEWRSVNGAARLLYHTLIRKAEGNDYSYFRRAVRANELFFVVDIKNLYKSSILKQVQGTL